jgi:hypothetical protein
MIGSPKSVSDFAIHNHRRKDARRQLAFPLTKKGRPDEGDLSCNYLNMSFPDRRLGPTMVRERVRSHSLARVRQATETFAPRRYQPPRK